MMTTVLMQLLLSYYICDYTASIRGMGFSEAQECAAIYEQVKTQISGLDSTNMDTRIAAYILWKQWEEENSDLVKILRQDARNIVERNQ